jgi:hypothetical protein
MPAASARREEQIVPLTLTLLPDLIPALRIHEGEREWSVSVYSCGGVCACACARGSGGSAPRTRARERDADPRAYIRTKRAATCEPASGSSSNALIAAIECTLMF